MTRKADASDSARHTRLNVQLPHLDADVASCNQLQFEFVAHSNHRSHTFPQISLCANIIFQYCSFLQGAVPSATAALLPMTTLTLWDFSGPAFSSTTGNGRGPRTGAGYNASSFQSAGVSRIPDWHTVNRSSFCAAGLVSDTPDQGVCRSSVHAPKSNKAFKQESRFCVGSRVCSFCYIWWVLWADSS